MCIINVNFLFSCRLEQTGATKDKELQHPLPRTKRKHGEDRHLKTASPATLKR